MKLLSSTSRYSAYLASAFLLATVSERAVAFSVAGPRSLSAVKATTLSRVGTRIYMEYEPHQRASSHLQETERLVAQVSKEEDHQDYVNNETLETLETSSVAKNTINAPSVVSQNLNDFLKTITNKYVAPMLAALIIASTFSPLAAFAAPSGGRMGGSYPSARSSSPPVTRMAPSSSSYYSRGYSRGFSSGLSSGYYSRPSIYVSPFSSPFGSPFSAFPTISPFYSPTYSYARPGLTVQSSGPNLLQFLVFGAVAISVANAVSNFGDNLTSGGSFFDDKRGNVSGALGSGVSVVQLSVAMEVPRRDDPGSILNALDRISRTARTDSRVGIQNLTSQVALELLRRKSSIVSASTKYNHFKDRERAQREFNGVAIKERSKFERETVSTYGGVDYSQNAAPVVTLRPKQPWPWLP